MRRRAFLHRAGLAGALAGLGGCVGAVGGPETRTVEMTDAFRFDPAAVTVDTGGRVEWVNVGRLGHTVTAYGDRQPGGARYFASGGFATERAARAGFPTGLIGAEETYEHTFETAGTHEYFCLPHEGAGMVGTVRVR